MSVRDLIELARAGGAALAITLLLALWGLWRGWLEMGPASRREVKFWTEYATEMRDERDDYKKQIEARQGVVDQAIELAGLLRDITQQKADDDRRRRR